MREALVYLSPKGKNESSPVPVGNMVLRKKLEGRGWKVVRTIDLDAPPTESKSPVPLDVTVAELEERVSAIEALIHRGPMPETPETDTSVAVDLSSAKPKQKPGPKPKHKPAE